MSRALHDLLDHLVRGLVDAPDEVRIRDVGEADAAVFELRVASADLGKVIGKRGGTVRALRTVLLAAAARDGRRVVLNILED